MARQNGSELAWFFAGLALGAAGALLTAPQSGDETRRQLREQAGKSRERLFEVSKTAASRGQELAGEAVVSGRRAYQRGRELYEKGRNLAEENGTEIANPPTPQPISEASDETPTEA
jgi:gas vesicle protein